jgi:Tfp pilus assembly protein PilF
MEVLPMGARIANALVSYWRYIGKMIWPSGLAVFYPHPGTSIPVWQFAAAGLGLLAVTALVVWKFRTRPFFVVGWFWYIGTLVPVIGLLQVGEQSMADRYTYIPLIGLFIIIAFGVPELLARWQVKKTALAVAGGGISAAFMFTTITQVGYWRDSRTLFQHALEVTSGNWVAHLNLGLVLAKQEKTSDAISHYTESLRIKPNYAKTHNDLGAALGKQGNLTGATVHLQRAIQIDPSLADAHNNLGITYAIQGKTPEAMEQFREAVRLNPDQWDAHYNLGLVLERQGKFDDAIAQYSNALRIKSDYTEARVALERTRRLQRESQGKTLPQNP